jgi:hypothetical protein
VLRRNGRLSAHARIFTPFTRELAQRRRDALIHRSRRHTLIKKALRARAAGRATHRPPTAGNHSSPMSATYHPSRHASGKEPGMTAQKKTTTSLVCALAASAAVLASAAPGHAAAATTADTIRPDQCFPIYTWRFTSAGVRIHQFAGTGSAGGAVYGLGYTGQLFTSSQWRTASSSGYTWFYGIDQSTGVTGWAATAYLSYLGNDGICLGSPTPTR